MPISKDFPHKIIREGRHAKRYGPWKHLEKPLFEDNGSHAMFFEDESGRKIMCIHAPERNMMERAHLYHMAEDGDALRIIAEIPI